VGKRPPTIHDVTSLHAWQADRSLAWSRLLITMIVLAFIVVLGRVVQLKLQPDPRLAAAVGSPLSKTGEIGRRGDILDRKGRVIATSAIGHRLFVDPQEVEDYSTIAVDIAHLIGGDPVEIDIELHKRPDSRYVVVSQLLESWQVEAVRTAGLKGVVLEPRPVRHYPYGELGAALVGTVGFENTGLTGVEHQLNETLAPNHGKLTYLRDARRRPLWITPDDYTPSEAGADVRLSIDLVIQQIAEQRLAEQVEAMNAGGGRIIVLDPHTGEILALHDILNPREGWEEQTEDPFRDIHPALGRNRCLTDPYEPGSTFKPFVWATATELGLAEPDEMLRTPGGPPGHRTSYGRIIRDAHYYGPSSWRKVLVKSMNSGMAIIAERMTHQQLRDVIERFGFGEKTYCGLKGETTGIITSAKDWSKYTQCSVAMGHEIAVTPVQMVRAFSAFARDGTTPALRLTCAEADEPYLFERRALPERVVLQTREVLRDVMTQGSGRKAQSEKYQLFGKSGTAQLPKKTGGGYHEDRYVSSFIAGAPYEHPRIVVLCVIDDPDKSRGHYGGAIAGPVVRDVIDDVLGYLGVKPDKAPPEDDGPLVMAR
jgi:cell division protein FtsI (penicillin-binding protein 3)